MDLLLELMKLSNYKDADKTAVNEWRSALEWAKKLYGKNASRRDLAMVTSWLRDLADFGAVETQDRDEGPTLFRAALV